MSEHVLSKHVGRLPVPLLERLIRRPRLAELSDRELVARAAGDDSHAFGELYERYVDDIYRYIELRVRDVDLAEDLTQDVFLRAFRALPDFEWQGHIRPWLLRIAHNRVANHWRSNGRRPQLEALPDEDGSTTAPLIDDGAALETVARRVDAEAVTHALRMLTDLQQQVIALRFGLELSVAETAAVMGRTKSSIKNLQYSALETFRARLTREDERP